MTTAELATALPEIVTEQVPGPKSKELLDRRDVAIPKALCGKTYPICIKQGSGAMFEDMDGNKVVTRSGGGYAGYRIFPSGSHRGGKKTD